MKNKHTDMTDYLNEIGYKAYLNDMVHRYYRMALQNVIEARGFRISGAIPAEIKEKALELTYERVLKDIQAEVESIGPRD